MKKNRFAYLFLGVSMSISVIAVSSVQHASAEDTFHGAVAEKSHYGVIFQVDGNSEPAIRKTLRNIQNVLSDPRLKGKIQVELISNAKGYVVYNKGSAWEKQLQDLKSQGVILAQCHNSLEEMKIDVSTLSPLITIVPSGVGEIVIRQGEGWAYIHPS